MSARTGVTIGMLLGAFLSMLEPANAVAVGLLVLAFMLSLITDKRKGR